MHRAVVIDRWRNERDSLRRWCGVVGVARGVDKRAGPERLASTSTASPLRWLNTSWVIDRSAPSAKFNWTGFVRWKLNLGRHCCPHGEPISRYFLGLEWIRLLSIEYFIKIDAINWIRGGWFTCYTISMPLLLLNRKTCRIGRRWIQSQPLPLPSTGKQSGRKHRNKKSELKLKRGIQSISDWRWNWIRFIPFEARIPAPTNSSAIKCRKCCNEAAGRICPGSFGRSIHFHFIKSCHQVATELNSVENRQPFITNRFKWMPNWGTIDANLKLASSLNNDKYIHSDLTRIVVDLLTKIKGGYSEMWATHRPADDLSHLNDGLLDEIERLLVLRMRSGCTGCAGCAGYAVFRVVKKRLRVVAQRSIFRSILVGVNPTIQFDSIPFDSVPFVLFDGFVAALMTLTRHSVTSNAVRLDGIGICVSPEFTH